MQLDLYKTFHSVAFYGNITKASEHLFITQPAVSRAIRQLEDNLGCSLFFRTPRGVTLTQEGEILYQHLDRAFNFISTAEKRIMEVKKLMEGEVRIGVSDTLCKYYLLPYLKLFNTLYPPIKVHVICPTTPGIIKLLKAGSIDFGIINLPYADEQLAFKNVMEVQDCFVTGEKYKQLSYRMQHIGQLSKFPLLLLERNSNSRTYIDSYFKEHKVSVTPAFELGNMDLLTHFARNDFGIACVIRNFVQDELDQGGLHEIRLVERIPPRSIGAAWLKDVPLTAAARELIRQFDTLETPEI